MAESDGDACAHDVTFAGMCVQCHRIVSTAPDKAKAMQRPGFLTTAVDLQVSASLLSSLDADEQVRRAPERKLVLVMDLDHTLVTADMRSMPSKMKIRKRPGVDDSSRSRGTPARFMSTRKQQAPMHRRSGDLGP